jgi:hypothetical protein
MRAEAATALVLAAFGLSFVGGLQLGEKPPPRAQTAAEIGAVPPILTDVPAVAELGAPERPARTAERRKPARKPQARKPARTAKPKPQPRRPAVAPAPPPPVVTAPVAPPPPPPPPAAATPAPPRPTATPKPRFDDGGGSDSGSFDYSDGS